MFVPLVLETRFDVLLARLCVMLLELMLNWLVALTNFVAVFDLVLRVPFML